MKWEHLALELLTILSSEPDLSDSKSRRVDLIWIRSRVESRGRLGSRLGGMESEIVATPNTSILTLIPLAKIASTVQWHTICISMVKGVLKHFLAAILIYLTATFCNCAIFQRLCPNNLEGINLQHLNAGIAGFCESYHGFGLHFRVVSICHKFVFKSPNRVALAI
jgi:hypothetical protein